MCAVGQCVCLCVWESSEKTEKCVLRGVVVEGIKLFDAGCRWSTPVYDFLSVLQRGVCLSSIFHRTLLSPLSSLSSLSTQFESVPQKHRGKLILHCTYSTSASHSYSCIFQVSIRGPSNTFQTLFLLLLQLSSSFSPQFFSPTCSISVPQLLFFLSLLSHHFLLIAIIFLPTHSLFIITNLSLHPLTRNMVVIYSRGNLSIY